MHSSTIEFRKATERNLDAIVKLWIDTLTYHTKLDSRLAVRPEAAKHGHTFFSKHILEERNYFAIASVNNTIIGYICVLI